MMRIGALSAGGARALVAASVLLAAACAPAAPASPAAAPAAPTTAAAPAKPPSVPTAKTVEKAETKPLAKAEGDAKAVEDFYKGKTLRIVVGFAPGGAYDVYSRLLARHMPRYVPGAPNMIVENKPGAGSVLAANAVYNTEPRDGSVIGTFNGLLTLDELTQREGLQFQFTRFNFLGVTASSHPMCVVTRESGFDSLADAKQRELILGASGTAGNLFVIPTVLREALDLQMKIVQGYGGTAPVRLAMDKNEVHGYCSTWEDTKATALEKVQTGEYQVIVQLTEQPLADLPNVPLATQLVTADADRQLIRFGSILPNRFLYQFAMPPDVPRTRVQAVREAFAAALKDPQLLADAQRSNLTIAPVNGEETERLIAEFFTMPDSTRIRLKSLLSDE